MDLLIVEDEPSIADHIAWCTRSILGKQIKNLRLVHELEDASEILYNKSIDLLLLDLNLNGENGYDLLKLAVSGSFHTIIISAHIEQAINAFEFGVLDFVPKPFARKRLKEALDRYLNQSRRRELNTKYLSVRKRNENILLPIDEVIFFKAAGDYVEAHLNNSRMEILDKSMDRLAQILPHNFFRIHRSYIIETAQIESYMHIGGGAYRVTTKTGMSLPLSRQKYKELHLLLKK